MIKKIIFITLFIIISFSVAFSVATSQYPKKNKKSTQTIETSQGLSVSGSRVTAAEKTLDKESCSVKKSTSCSSK